ncbi:unnamed protein product [Aureobasidium uvarum]|uniref:ARID domain-containing protein n=1 Tax=Aureobasidium uvarum TaxID=2773716 RepID=A0A9N8KF07_9PEZI|nr:unnamed protein product [Aureobasidium uvarum]
MPNRLPILIEEDLNDRTDVLSQATVNQPADLSDMTVTEEEVAQYENGCESKPESDNESDVVSQSSVEESWIPLEQVQLSMRIIALLICDSPRIAAPLIQVVVGGHSFSVFKHMLCIHSPFFERALNGPFREAMQDKIELKEGLDLFQIFNHWLSLPPRTPPWTLLRKALVLPLTLKASNVSWHFSTSTSLQDRLQFRGLCKAAFTHFDKVLRPSGLPGRASVAAICQADESLLKDNGLWKYLIAIERDANRCGAPRRPAEDYGHLPDLFVFELLKMTEEDSKSYLQVSNKSVDLFELKRQVNHQGGYERAEHRHKWGVICVQMGIRLDNHRRIFTQMRNIYRTWLGPFDNGIKPQERLTLERQCRRPLVRKFF